MNNKYNLEKKWVINFPDYVPNFREPRDDEATRVNSYFKDIAQSIRNELTNYLSSIEFMKYLAQFGRLGFDEKRDSIINDFINSFQFGKKICNPFAETEAIENQAKEKYSSNRTEVIEYAKKLKIFANQETDEELKGLSNKFFKDIRENILNLEEFPPFMHSLEEWSWIIMENMYKSNFTVERVLNKRIYGPKSNVDYSLRKHFERKSNPNCLIPAVLTIVLSFQGRENQEILYR